MMTTPRNIARAPRDRRADLAAIHMIEKQLYGDDRDAARDLKLQVIGKASSGDMSDAERRRYLKHLHSVQKGTTRPAARRSADDPRDDRWNMARALWAGLAAAGHVRVDTDAALLSYVKRQTGAEQWRWLNGYQINAVIESLKKWAAREDAKQ
ncbi:regulatory protein GemA [Burkholderia sp. BCC0397]|uniref:regulatory protein GemA n=1 Tax=Burkholderia sp. BCC0397 TaxID=486876 RepID=UPI00158B21E1|nr:regulatory protein GemA [Burkholderia sp. BCC0397]